LDQRALIGLAAVRGIERFALLDQSYSNAPLRVYLLEQ
jgi:hypothetical protein